MDLRQIEYMIAIAEEKSISKAADKLFMTQSALNQQLLKLENELGTKLFYRKRSSMEPTEAGNIYLACGRRMVEMKKETYKKIRDLTNEDRGRISLACTPEKGSELFSYVYPYFHDAYPHITFKLTEATPKNMEQMVLREEVDLALSTSSRLTTFKDKIKYVEFKKEQIVLGVSKNAEILRSVTVNQDPDDRFPRIDLKVFKDARFVLMDRGRLIREIVDMKFESENIKPVVLFEAKNHRTVLEMIRQQMCVGFVPESYTKENDDIAFFSLEPEEYWSLGVIFLKDLYLTKAEQYFLELCREYHQGELKPWNDTRSE